MLELATELYDNIDIEEDDNEESRNETERPISPIPMHRRSNQMLKDALAAEADLRDSIRVKIPMANFRKVAKATERRNSFECVTYLLPQADQNPTEE